MDGKQVSDEQGIADVLESLYKKQHDKDGAQFFASGKQDTPEVSEEEVKVALKKMQNGNTTDNSCIVADAEILRKGTKTEDVGVIHGDLETARGHPRVLAANHSEGLVQKWERKTPLQLPSNIDIANSIQGLLKNCVRKNKWRIGK